MSVFTVDLKNQPGELARLCEAMAGRGVNLILCATTRGEDGTVAFVAGEPQVLRQPQRDQRLAQDMLHRLAHRLDGRPRLREVLAAVGCLR